MPRKKSEKQSLSAGVDAGSLSSGANLVKKEPPKPVIAMVSINFLMVPEDFFDVFLSQLRWHRMERLIFDAPSMTYLHKFILAHKPEGDESEKWKWGPEGPSKEVYPPSGEVLNSLVPRGKDELLIAAGNVYQSYGATLVRVLHIYELPPVTRLDFMPTGWVTATFPWPVTDYENKIVALQTIASSRYLQLHPPKVTP